MVNRKGDFAQGDEKAKRRPLNGSPLDGILADMLRSALAWDEEHGSSLESDGISFKRNIADIAADHPQGRS